MGKQLIRHLLLLLFRLRYGFKTGEPNTRENNKNKNSNSNSNKTNQTEKEGGIEIDIHQGRKVGERGMVAHQVETTRLILIITTTLQLMQTAFWWALVGHLLLPRLVDLLVLRHLRLHQLLCSDYMEDHIFLECQVLHRQAQPLASNSCCNECQHQLAPFSSCLYF